MIGWIIWSCFCLFIIGIIILDYKHSNNKKRYFHVSFAGNNPTTKQESYGDCDFIVKSLGHINQAECIAQIKDIHKELEGFQIVIQNIYEFECKSDYNDWIEKKLDK